MSRLLSPLLKVLHSHEFSAGSVRLIPCVGLVKGLISPAPVYGDVFPESEQITILVILFAECRGF